jgi:Vitamin K-dependent gamma-carboxylase
VIHPIRAWNRFFFGLVSAKPLGAIRILYGLVALCNLGFCAVDLEYWYTDSGLLRGDEAWIMAGIFQPSPLHFLQDVTSVRIAFGLTAVFAALLTIGWRTRLVSILYYIGILSIHNRNLVSSSGADVLLLITGFNLMLSPCGAAYSVDAWLASRKRGTPASPVILAWALRLIQIQIAVVYMGSSILKSGGVLWLNGSALHYVLNNDEVIRFDVSFLTQYPLLINLMTYSALAMEFSLAFFIWSRAARPFVLYLGLMLHAGILITINIPCFGELMWIGYLAFLTPPEFDAFLHAIDVRRLFHRAKAEENVEVESEPEIEVSEFHEPVPAFRPSSIIVRIDSGSALAGPHCIDAAASRPFELAARRNTD